MIAVGEIAVKLGSWDQDAAQAGELHRGIAFCGQVTVGREAQEAALRGGVEPAGDGCHWGRCTVKIGDSAVSRQPSGVS